MARTKLDKHRVSKREKDLERDAYIIRKAMAANRIYTYRDLASLVGVHDTYISKCFKNGFSPNMKVRLCGVLNFSESDFRDLMGVRF